MSRVPIVDVSPGAIAAADIAAAAQLACLLEATAPKPGNVSPGRRFDDIAYEHFLASAAAIGGPLSGAGTCPLGATVRLAIEATARWSSSNTNLGIVLLLAPLARAAHALLDTTVRLKADTTGSKGTSPDADRVVSGFSRTSGDAYSVVSGFSRTRDDPNTVVSGFSRTSDNPDSLASGFSRALRDAARHVLDATTVDDAREVYAAIRCAAPGGLGRVEAQDVANEPDVTLLETMRLAAGRDGIAREYATAFEVTFGTGVPALDRARRDGLSWSDAVLETFLTLLAAAPDTHVVRRGGSALAEEVSRRARAVLDGGGVRSAAGRRAIDAMDVALRDERHTANPGTTADLTAAAIFVVLLAGGWSRPTS
jgi:triphosphoribosyl-dephospho-CoA synthase